MKHPDATLLEQRLSKACPTTQHAAILMAQRDELGVERYKTTVDDNPSTARQWARHAADEAADGLKYAIRAEEEARKMELEIEALRGANAALVERVKRLEEAAGLALGYAAKGDFETADEVLTKAKTQP